MRGATDTISVDTATEVDFYSRTSCEVRLSSNSLPTVTTFLLTHLLRGATFSKGSSQPDRLQFLLTHLLRGATSCPHAGNGATNISTHAPLARCDVCNICQVTIQSISTHAPLARCDNNCVRCFILYIRFLLTHLLRGATCNKFIKKAALILFLLTHLLRGATRHER